MLLSSLKSFFAPLLCLSLSWSCASTQQESRQLSARETADLQEFVGSYSGNIYAKRTTRADAKPMLANVKLELLIQDDTLVVTSDKDLSGGECPTEIGRLTSLNFSEHSMLATFAYENASCDRHLNMDELTVEARSGDAGRGIKLTTKLPKLISIKKSDKKPKRPGFLYGNFEKVQSVEDQDLEGE